MKELLEQIWKKDIDAKSKSQIMKNNGYQKIWDCGNQKWIWTKNDKFI